MLRTISVLIVVLSLVFCVSCTSSTNESVSADSNPVIIIGGGLMGSATAWQLADRSVPVLLLEKQDSTYDTGSSLGEARIARSSNRGDDIWSYMHNTSVAEVERLIKYLSAVYPSGTFNMSDIYTTNPVSYLGKMRIYDKLMASLIRQKVDYNIAVSPEEGKALFDVDLPEDVLLQREYNLHSGTINPEKLIGYLHLAIKAKGGTVLYNHQVVELKKKKDQFLITTKSRGKQNRTFESNRVVSAAGPYTGPLLRQVAPYFDTLINPQRVFLAFYKIRKEVYEMMGEGDMAKLKEAYPVINSSKGTRDGSFFSMIEYYDEDGLPVIKVGGHFQRSEIEDLDKIWSKDLDPTENEWAFNSTMGYFRLLGLPVSDADLIYDHGYSCVYSLTADEVPLVTPLIDKDGTPDSNFIVLGGMSGVGAKGAMTYGVIGADLMLGIERSDTMYQHVKERLALDLTK